MQQPLQTEALLLAGLAAGDRQATEQVYRQQWPVVSHWIRNQGGLGTDAADIFQEAMVILYEKAQQPDFRLSCRIGTYLFSICRHLWLKRLQQLQKAPLRLPEDEDATDWQYEEDISMHQEREQHYQQLNAALDQLGEPCSSLLRAFYHQSRSMQDIAAAFGYTNPDNAKTQKYKCLTRLKKIFFGAQAKQ